MLVTLRSCLAGVGMESDGAGLEARTWLMVGTSVAERIFVGLGVGRSDDTAEGESAPSELAVLERFGCDNRGRRVLGTGSAGRGDVGGG